MSMNSNYQVLNLPEGASINDIKAAFRKMAKNYHPDAAGVGQADVEKFIKAQTAYQQLMKKAVAYNRAKRAGQTGSGAADHSPAANWRFKGRRDVGLDVYYSLFMLRPATDGLKIILPWQIREACPRCLGQGRTLARIGQNSLYRPCACAKCNGTGHVDRESRLEINITADMVGRSKIRLRKAGLYNAKTAERGDLILDISWTDRLPEHN